MQFISDGFVFLVIKFKHDLFFLLICGLYESWKGRFFFTSFSPMSVLEKIEKTLVNTTNFSTSFGPWSFSRGMSFLWFLKLRLHYLTAFSDINVLYLIHMKRNWRTVFCRVDVLISKWHNYVYRNSVIYIKFFFVWVLSNVEVIIIHWHERHGNVSNKMCSPLVTFCLTFWQKFLNVSHCNCTNDLS